jgi:hypothetical protein
MRFGAGEAGALHCSRICPGRGSRAACAAARWASAGRDRPEAAARSAKPFEWGWWRRATGVEGMANEHGPARGGCSGWLASSGLWTDSRSSGVIQAGGSSQRADAGRRTVPGAARAAGSAETGWQAGAAGRREGVQERGCARAGSPTAGARRDSGTITTSLRRWWGLGAARSSGAGEQADAASASKGCMGAAGSSEGCGGPAGATTGSGRIGGGGRRSGLAGCGRGWTAGCHRAAFEVGNPRGVTRRPESGKKCPQTKGADWRRTGRILRKSLHTAPWGSSGAKGGMPGTGRLALPLEGALAGLPPRVWPRRVRASSS